MAIEFHCPHCDKFLKTNDDKAGMQVNCPGCGGPLTIPHPMAAEATTAAPVFTAAASTASAAQLVRHRGELILVFGLLSWFVCPIFGIVAWVMANQDLAAMAAGQMDPSGRGLTQARKIVSMVVLGLILLAFLVVVLFALFGLVVGIANA